MSSFDDDEIATDVQGSASLRRRPRTLVHPHTIGRRTSSATGSVTRLRPAFGDGFALGTRPILRAELPDELARVRPGVRPDPTPAPDASSMRDTQPLRRSMPSIPPSSPPAAPRVAPADLPLPVAPTAPDLALEAAPARPPVGWLLLGALVLIALGIALVAGYVAWATEPHAAIQASAPPST